MIVGDDCVERFCYMHMNNDLVTCRRDMLTQSGCNSQARLRRECRVLWLQCRMAACQGSNKLVCAAENLYVLWLHMHFWDVLQVFMVAVVANTLDSCGQCLINQALGMHVLSVVL